MQHSSYLESKVLTAPPQRLHLMLIEGAIRFGRLAEDALKRGDTAAASAPLLRVIDITGEMLAVVRENKTELNKKLADVYWFLFRRASEAKINSDSAVLGDVLRLLEYERQTWQLVCEKLGGASGTSAAGPPSPHGFNVAPMRTATPGFSLEA